MDSKENDLGFVIREENCSGCQRCQLVCSMLYHNIFNPAIAYIQVLQTTDNGISFKVRRTNNCTECGSCVEACAFGCLIEE